MLMPSIFGENLFDDNWMDFPFEREFWGRKNPLYGKNAKNMMKTDIREHDAGYELDIDLPGFKKEDIKVTLENGYMTISAQKDSPKETKNGRFIRKERFSGACERSFYVGDNLTQEDIQGEFKHGVLKLRIPKKEAAPQVEENKYITIE